MDPEDARLAIERHATSKIRRADDLAAILTLGFRGEALPSIASVSHFMLRSRARGRPSGTEIRVNGGVIASDVEAACPEGTLVEVNDVFYNLPARRKFLKSDAAESHSGLARHHAARAGLSRNRDHADERRPDRRSVSARRARFATGCINSYGERERPDRRVQGKLAGSRVTGFIAALASQGPTRGPQHVFINRRIVKDRTDRARHHRFLQPGLDQGAQSEVHLFIEMPADTLDVNVHPTKAEVRFRDQSLVHEVVRRALMEALGSRLDAPAAVAARKSTSVSRWPVAIPHILSGGEFPSRWIGTGGGGARRADRQRPFGRAFAEAAPEPRPAMPAADIRPMIPLGQFRDTFIIAVDAEGVAIIDQHVAHERVLFERVMERLHIGTAGVAAAARPAPARTSRRRPIRHCSDAPRNSIGSATKLEAVRRHDDQSRRGAGSDQDRR